MTTNTLAGPVEINWDIVPGEDESTLLDDMCELGDLNMGLPTYVIMEALSRRAAQSPGNGVILDALLRDITAVARELVERGTHGA